MNLTEVFLKFKTQDDCIAFLEDKRWNNVATCPYCSSKKSHKNIKENRHYCHSCKTSYSVTVNTIFHHTHIELQKWFLAIALITNAKKGISSRQLARDLDVNPNTAWRMQMQIRKAMIEDFALMKGICEMDETYVGGKPRKRNNNNDDNNSTPIKRGRGTTKTPVVGIVERGGKVNAKVMNRLKFVDLKKMAKDNIDLNSVVLMTDDYKGYVPFAKLVKHESVNHSQKQYVKGNIHTNTIEGFWSLLKRGITGQYHWLSDKYLNRYITEFCFKYNNRNEDMFDLILSKMVLV